MNDIDKIKDKIKKLLALSKSPNPNEAATALKMARELMAEYKVEKEDVSNFDISEESFSTVFRYTPPRYESDLISCIAYSFGCRALWSYKDGNRVWQFIGLKHRAQIAAYICHVLLRKLKKARSAYIKTLFRVRSKYCKTQRADDFCSGWVSSVSEKLVAFAGVSAEEKKAIDHYLKKNFPSVKELNSIDRSFGRAIDHYHGTQAGEGVELQHGVSGEFQNPLYLEV